MLQLYLIYFDVYNFQLLRETSSCTNDDVCSHHLLFSESLSISLSLLFFFFVLFQSHREQLCKAVSWSFQMLPHVRLGHFQIDTADIL
jgi:hypothetical protein